MTVHFDPLDYADTLEGAGLSRAHAEAIAKVQAKALADLVANDLVTKDFLRSELTQLETRSGGTTSRHDTLSERTLSSGTRAVLQDIYKLKRQGIFTTAGLIALVLVDAFVG